MLVTEAREESQLSEEIGVRETTWPKNTADLEEEAGEEEASGKERDCLSPGTPPLLPLIGYLPFH